MLTFIPLVARGAANFAFGVLDAPEMQIPTNFPFVFFNQAQAWASGC